MSRPVHRARCVVEAASRAGWRRLCRKSESSLMSNGTEEGVQSGRPCHWKTLLPDAVADNLKGALRGDAQARRRVAREALCRGGACESATAAPEGRMTVWERIRFLADDAASRFVSELGPKPRRGIAGHRDYLALMAETSRYTGMILPFVPARWTRPTAKNSRVVSSWRLSDTFR